MLTYRERYTLKNVRKIIQERNLHQTISTNDEKIKLIAPFEDFPRYYKIEFASLKEGSSFRIPFILQLKDKDERIYLLWSEVLFAVFVLSEMLPLFVCFSSGGVAAHTP